MIDMAWCIYAVGIGAIVACASWITERILTRSSVAIRWIWATGLGLAVLLPAVRISPPSGPVAGVGPLMVSAAPTSSEAVRDGGSLFAGLGGFAEIAARPVSDALERLASLAPAGPSADTLLFVLWAAASTVVAVLLGAAHMRIRRQARSWPLRTIDGVPVHVSSRFGPATVGILTPEIVLPAWAAALPDRERRMVVRHEMAHVAAGDTRLLAAGLIPAVVMPWNPFVWWMVGRLRDAVELDCDRRTMAEFRSRTEYGRLLLDLGRYPVARTSVIAPALAGRPSLLERRLRALKRLKASGPGRATWVGACVVAVMALVVACGTDVPADDGDVASPTTGVAPAPEGTPAPPEPSPEPAPEPISATTPEPDAAPGRDDPRPVVPDRSRPVSLDGPGVGAIPDTPGGDDISAQPTFTPYEVAPEIRNRQVVAQALEREYPTQLRDAGIGGRILLHFFINESGRLDNVQIAQSSGFDQLDEAALRVSRVFEFSPALNRGAPTAVWIQVPVTFEAR